MRVLAIETSGLEGSVAVLDDGTVHTRSLATAGRRHAQTLTLEIQELLASRQLKPRDLEAVAVSLGPGSFTGLRVGVVCAKTMAYALKCQFIGIETFQAIVSHGVPVSSGSKCGVAEGNSDFPIKGRVFVVSEAQRGDLFCAEFSLGQSPHGWQRTSDHLIVPGEEWLQSLSVDDVVLGPGLTRYCDEASPATCLRSDASLKATAAALIPLASRRLADGNTDDPWLANPIYLRPSAAEEQWDRKLAVR